MKPFKLTVKDIQGNILHNPEFDTLEEAQAMKERIEQLNEWNFPEGFVVSIEDNTPKIEAENQVKAAKLAKIQAVKALNLDAITTVAQCKAALKVMAAMLLKDEV